MRIARLVVPTTFALALAACGGEPGAAELEEARKLQAENHRAEAAAAFEQIARAFPGTPAALQAEAALDAIHCEDAHVDATAAWTAARVEADDDAGIPQVEPADVQARLDAFTAARAAADGCAPEGADAACADALTTARHAAEALATVYADICASQAWRAARAALGTAAGAAIGGGEVPTLDGLVTEAATAAATTCVSGLVDAPASALLAPEAIGRAVADQVLTTPVVLAVRAATAEVVDACAAPEADPEPELEAENEAGD